MHSSMAAAFTPPHQGDTLVVVPFRDTPDGSRAEQLAAFRAHMDATLPPGTRCVIAQQADDGNKFNRGAVLNAGVLAGAAAMGWTAATTRQRLILHDVDALPDPHVAARYCTCDVSHAPVHFGALFQRYNFTPGCTGGVLACSMAWFMATNGFPNSFWGWGGEDDELRRRAKDAGMPPSEPPADMPEGAGYIDLESHSPDGTPLRHPPPHASACDATKNMHKWEGAKAQRTLWRTDGVRQCPCSITRAEDGAPSQAEGCVWDAITVAIAAPPPALS
jgi:hypothetical protein